MRPIMPFRPTIGGGGSSGTASLTSALFRSTSSTSTTTPTPPLRILLLSTSFNGMTAHIQRVLNGVGHSTHFSPTVSTKSMLSVYKQSFAKTGGGGLPDLIVCPTLKARIPSEIFSRTLSFILHPGPVGDRGPHSLDWAILNNVAEWGLTVLEAAEEMDGGRVWAAGRFKMPDPGLHRTKAQLYNDPTVVSLASSLVLQAVEKVSKHLTDDAATPPPPSEVIGVIDPPFLAAPHRTILAGDTERVIDWAADTTEDVLRKMRAADSSPGLKATLKIGEESLTRFLYNGSRANDARAVSSYPNCEPGSVYGTDAHSGGEGGIYVATKDGGVRVGVLRAAKSAGIQRNTFKTPAAIHLGPLLPQSGIPVIQSRVKEDVQVKFEILKVGRVGLLRYDFYNGALSTGDCHRLLTAVQGAAASEPSLSSLIIVGAANGIHLNVCEHSESPEHEAMRNLVAINAVVKAILRSTHLITVSVLESSVGAGGYWLAAASDLVFGTPGIVLNPHYCKMGLYGSELHTYTGVRRLGSLEALVALKETAPSLTVSDASRIGLLDNALLSNIPNPGPSSDFLTTVLGFVGALVEDQPRLASFLIQKKETRKADETSQSLDNYERAELLQMEKCIFGNQWGFKEKREAFVYKLNPTTEAETKQPDVATNLRGEKEQRSFDDIWPHLVENGERKESGELTVSGAQFKFTESFNNI